MRDTEVLSHKMDTCLWLGNDVRIIDRNMANLFIYCIKSMIIFINYRPDIDKRIRRFTLDFMAIKITKRK